MFEKCQDVVILMLFRINARYGLGCFGQVMVSIDREWMAHVFKFGRFKTAGGLIPAIRVKSRSECYGGHMCRRTCGKTEVETNPESKLSLSTFLRVHDHLISPFFLGFEQGLIRQGD